MSLGLIFCIQNSDIQTVSKCPKVLGFSAFVMLNEFQIQMILKKWFVRQAGISSPFSHAFSSQLLHSMPICWLLWNTKLILGKCQTDWHICADRSESIKQCAVNKRCSLWRFIGENMLCTDILLHCLFAEFPWIYLTIRSQLLTSTV